MGVDATAMSGESNVVVAKCEKLTIPAFVERIFRYYSVARPTTVVTQRTAASGGANAAQRGKREVGDLA